jgi:glycosyltransferase involved in cell wall biosynthesis
MKKLMIFVDWFAPGFNGGGQIQSCVNLAIALQDEMEVLVVTTDRDLGSTTPYESVRADEWNQFDRKIKVLYLSPKNLGFKFIKRIIGAADPDVIYLNSMFSFSLTLLPLEACRLEKWKTKIVLAPRGMLHEGALQYKKLKKQLFFWAFKLRGFHRRIRFHATDRIEETDIKKVFGNNVKLTFADDFPSSNIAPLSLITKEKGELKCIFVSRISPKKNLVFALQVLKNITCKVSFTIVGPAEDEEYWKLCQSLIAALPRNITVEYAGSKANNELSYFYQQSHLFFLPTFGHVIFEALSNGRPVLISDQTPWKNLQYRKVGWEIPLDDHLAFANALNTACQWDDEEFQSYCQASWQLASGMSDTSGLAKKYLLLFQ